MAIENPANKIIFHHLIFLIFFQYHFLEHLPFVGSIIIAKIIKINFIHLSKPVLLKIIICSI